METAKHKLVILGGSLDWISSPSVNWFSPATYTFVDYPERYTLDIMQVIPGAWSVKI